MPAILMGVAAGVVCYLACTVLKNRFQYDDSLDAFGVHGVGGTLGAILTGVFATRHTTDPAVTQGKPLGLIDGSVSLLIGQVVAVIATWVLAIVMTFILLKIVDLLVGLRVTPEAEIQGLDLSEHGEEGYIFL
jgi:Amt family ammonium transporter